MGKVDSRHDDCMQIKWTVGDKSAVLNLSGWQVDAWDSYDPYVEALVEDFLAGAVLMYQEMKDSDKESFPEDEAPPNGELEDDDE